MLYKIKLRSFFATVGAECCALKVTKSAPQGGQKRRLRKPVVLEPENSEL